MSIQLAIRQKKEISAVLGYSGKVFDYNLFEKEFISKPKIKFLHGNKDEIVPVEEMYKSLEFLNKKQSIFPYDLKKLSKNRDGSTDYNAIKYSPYGNEILKDLALKAIIEEELGSDDITDFVHIGFSSPDHIGHKFGSNSKEVQDTYIRLDRTIEEILNFLDKEIRSNAYSSS